MRKICLTLIILILIISQTGCGHKEPISKSDFCLNTICEIRLYDIDKSAAEKILDDAFDEIRRYESLLSKTIPGSDIDRINSSKGSKVEVSEATIEVIKQGIYMGELSEGLFDITIGQLTALWDFSGENPTVPLSSEIEQLITHVNYENIKIEDSFVALTDDKAQLDLGGIAKGYVADRITELLESSGVTKAMINLGGNIVAIGEKAEDMPWSIGIERPYSDRTEIIGAIKVKDETVVTSGIYERMFYQDGKLYHHVLDSRTGYPAESDLEAVTIRATKGNSGLCDGLSTVCLMLGNERAEKLIKELQEMYPEKHIEASFIDINNSIIETPGMKIK